MPRSFSTLPALTPRARWNGTAWPSSSAFIGAPASAIHVSVLNLSDGPVTVISSPAAVSGLSSNLFARRNDNESIGPEGGTPMSQ